MDESYFIGGIEKRMKVVYQVVRDIQSANHLIHKMAIYLNKSGAI